MYKLLHPRQEAQNYPEIALSSRAAQKHPPTPLQRLCCPNKPLLGGDAALSDAGEGGMLGKAWAAEGAGARLMRGGLRRSWDPGLRLPLPGNLPTPRVLALLSSQNQHFPPGLACRWAQNGPRIWGPYSCPVFRDKTWIHLHSKAGLGGRFCKAELAG